MAGLQWKRPVAEFVAIFAGVTLSLLADDWRQERNDLRAERAALELIHADLLKDTSELRFALSPAENHESSTLWLLEHWDDPTIPLDSVGHRLRAYLFGNSFQFQASAFASLRDAGNIGLIRNDTLRSAIVGYYEESQVNTVQFLDFLFDQRSELLSAISRHFRLPPPRDAIRAWPLSGPLRRVSDWPAVRDDIELVNQITMVGSLATLTLRIGGQNVAANQDLRAAISSELAAN